MQPLAQIGGTLVLTSKTVTGRFKIVGVEHDGTNWTPGNFQTSLELRALT